MPRERMLEDMRMQAAGAPPGASMGDPQLVEQTQAILSQLPPEVLQQITSMPPEQLAQILMQVGVPQEMIPQMIEIIMSMAEGMNVGAPQGQGGQGNIPAPPAGVPGGV